MKSRKKKKDIGYNPQKILTTGAGGMVGSYVDFGTRLRREDLDITDINAVLSAVKKTKPDIILHLAAMTDVDQCEKEPDKAYKINAIGTYNVALAARNTGAKLVYISTLGVFDGTKKGSYGEKDLPNPQNHYGHSKYAGELIVRNLLDDYIIARACWMMGGGPKTDKKFIKKIAVQLEKGATEIKALKDVYGSPTFGKDLIDAIKKLLAKNARGVFHLTNRGKCTRFDVAEIIAKKLKPSAKVTAVDSNYFNLPAKRAINESSISKVNLTRPWKEALIEYLETEWPKYE